MDKINGVLALLFGVLGGAAVLALAAVRHLPIGDHEKELLSIAANQQIIHSMLGILAIFFHVRLGIFGKIAILLCAIGMALFTIPIALLGFKILAHTPSAPFGGMAFTLAWICIGIGAFRYSFSIGKQNDSA